MPITTSASPPASERLEARVTAEQKELFRESSPSPDQPLRLFLPIKTIAALRERRGR